MVDLMLPLKSIDNQILYTLLIQHADSFFAGS